MKQIGILVSGGDAPGVNAAIEAAVRHLAANDAQAWGARGGFAGLLAGNLERLDFRQAAGLGARGGVFLGTSRERALAEADAAERLRQVWARFQLDGLLVLGGDGTIRQAAKIVSDWDYPLIALPCTIDNDVPLTERTLGHDSAQNRALPMMDAIRDTATALSGRLFMVETLGGHTGHLALAIAFAAQADAVAVPEIPPDTAAVAARMRAAVEQRGYGLAVVGEGIGNVPDFCAAVAKAAGYRVRLTTLGHAQRGGPPSALDRALARTWGEMASARLLAGESGQMLAWQAGAVAAASLADVFAAPPKALDRQRYEQINNQNNGK